jgi:hypothetical protein
MQNFIVNCPLYFNTLPPMAGSCHGQDQSTTTLHESTHATYVNTFQAMFVSDDGLIAAYFPQELWTMRMVREGRESLYSLD